MTSITDIITDAWRESNMIGEGTTPSSQQQTDGLARLQSIVSAVFGWDAGEELQPWMVGSVGQVSPDVGWTSIQWAYPLANSRILLCHSAAETLYFPTNPMHGARMQIIDVHSALATYNVTLDGNGQLIDGAATVTLSTAGLNKTWLYNAQTANWAEIVTLALGNQMPFPEEFDDFFIIKLAARLNPRYGRTLSDLSIARLMEQQEQLAARYRQSRTKPAQLAVRNLHGPRDYDIHTGRGGRFGWTP